MNDMTIREVDYHFCQANMQAIVNLVTAAFMGNHKITKDAYAHTAEIYKDKFIQLLNKSTEDLIEQCQKNKGMYFVAESQQKIIGFSMGSPYENEGLSKEFVESVFQSPCSFQEVMKGWWDLMGKYAGTPPGKIYHQGPMAVAPEFAKRGIGEQLCALTAKRILETGYDGFAVETSSESADGLAKKMKRTFKVIDVDSNGAGLTFRLHLLHRSEKSQGIQEWFLAKKEPQALPKEINVQEISKIGAHYEVGNIVVWDSNRESKQPVVILLHPNSSSRLFFKKQIEDRRLTERYRLIAIDLPGHGDSKPAEDPHTTYTFQGYAQEIAKVVKQLGIAECAVLGWSLGGHVAMECLDKIEGLRGIALTGAPPVAISAQGFGQAFKGIPTDMAKLMGKRHFTREEAVAFASGVGKEAWMVEYQLKTDGRARERLMEWIAQGMGGDQRSLVAETKLPIALIAGDHDPASPRDYLESLKFGNLWGMRYIPGCGHEVVYEKADIYNAIFLEFLNDVFR